MNRVLILVVLVTLALSERVDAGPLRIPELQRRRDTFGTDLKKICETRLEKGPLKIGGTAASSPSPQRKPDQLSRADAASATKLAAYLNDLLEVCLALKGNPADIASLGASKVPDAMTLLRELRANPRPVAEAIDAIAKENDSDATKLFNPFTEQGTPSGGTGNAVSTLEGVSEKVLAGLGNFLVTRFKAEAADFLKRQIRDRVCNEKNARILLENLCAAFEDFDLSLSINAMGSYLQAAARADLEALPEGVLQVGADECAGTDANECASALAGARVGLAVYRAVRRGSDPIEVIRGISEMDPLECEAANPPHGSCVEFMKHVRAASLVVGAVDDLDLEAIGEVTLDQRGYYVIAVVLRLENLADALNLPSATGIAQIKAAATAAKAEVQANFGRVQRLVQELMALRVAAQNLITQAQNAAAAAGATGEGLDKARVRAAITVAIGALRQLANVVAEHDRDAAAWLNEVSDFGAALIEKRLNDAVTAGLTLIRHAHASLCEKKKACTKIAVPEKVMQLVPFLTEVITAESSAEVAKAIEAAAAPVGSWRQKYKRKLVAINGMVGGAVGGERLTGVQDSGAPIVTLFAPVGLHATAPNCRAHCEHFGVFLSVIDLGTYVSARLDQPSGDEMEDVADDSTVSIQQVISPGLYLTVGFSDDVPIVLGFGGAYTPSARRVEAMDGSERDTGALRLQAFVAVDIPIVLY